MTGSEDGFDAKMKELRDKVAEQLKASDKCGLVPPSLKAQTAFETMIVAPYETVAYLLAALEVFFDYVDIGEDIQDEEREWPQVPMPYDAEVIHDRLMLRYAGAQGDIEDAKRAIDKLLPALGRLFKGLSTERKRMFKIIEDSLPNELSGTNNGGTGIRNVDGRRVVIVKPRKKGDYSKNALAVMAALIAGARPGEGDFDPFSEMLSKLGGD